MTQPLSFDWTVNVYRIEVELNFLLDEKVAIQTLFPQRVGGTHGMRAAKVKSVFNRRRRRRGFTIDLKRQSLWCGYQQIPDARPIIERRVENIYVTERAIISEVCSYA